MQKLIRKGFNKMQKLIRKPNNVQDNLCFICIEATEDPVHIEIFKGEIKMYEGELKMTVCQNCVKTHAPDLVEVLQDLYVDIMDETDGWIKLIIQSNNVRYSPNCYICEEVTESAVPFEIFEAESKKVVCESCALAHDPHLVVMLRDWYREHEEEFFQEDAELRA